mmetsp:Transcript_39989/g.103237  ORF Transcript_39989/g.103237 Transcript_39989/m.103237 type:complete len:326 (+) Transcript_39989:2102-3079(+)
MICGPTSENCPSRSSLNKANIRVHIGRIDPVDGGMRGEDPLHQDSPQRIFPAIDGMKHGVVMTKKQAQISFSVLSDRGTVGAKHPHAEENEKGKVHTTHARGHAPVSRRKVDVGRCVVGTKGRVVPKKGVPQTVEIGRRTRFAFRLLPRVRGQGEGGRGGLIRNALDERVHPQQGRNAHGVLEMRETSKRRADQLLEVFPRQLGQFLSPDVKDGEIGGPKAPPPKVAPRPVVEARCRQFLEIREADPVRSERCLVVQIVAQIVAAGHHFQDVQLARERVAEHDSSMCPLGTHPPLVNPLDEPGPPFAEFGVRKEHHVARARIVQE